MRRLPFSFVIVEDPDFDLLADGEHVGRLLYARRNDLADVKKGIEAAEVDEGAVIGEAADGAGQGSPSPSSWRAAFVGSGASSSRTARRSTTTSSLVTSSLVMRQLISCPTSFPSRRRRECRCGRRA